MKRYILPALFLLLASSLSAQVFSVSTNALDWANLGTVNAQAGVALGRHLSLHAGARYNNWNFGNAEKGNAFQNRARTAYLGVRFWPWNVYSSWWFSTRAQVEEISNCTTGRLTATAACSGKTVTATYQGKKATATYTAETLECPESLAIGALESQEDPDRNFVIRKVSVTVSTAFASGTTSREQVSEVDCSTSGLIEAHGYVSGSGWQFRFTSAGTGSVTFSYTLNGQTVSSTVNLRCDGNGKVRKL